MLLLASGKVRKGIGKLLVPDQGGKIGVPEFIYRNMEIAEDMGGNGTRSLEPYQLHQHGKMGSASFIPAT
jgi:hypothetical protein